MAKEIEVMLHVASGVCRHFGFSLHFTGQYLLDVLASVNTAARTQRSFQQSLGTETSTGCTVWNLLCPSNDTAQSQAGGNKDPLGAVIPQTLTLP